MLRDTQMPAFRFGNLSCTTGLCQGQRRQKTRGVTSSHCSAQLQRAFFFNVVFVAYSFSSHLTLTEICFNY